MKILPKLLFAALLLLGLAHGLVIEPERTQDNVEPTGHNETAFGGCTRWYMTPGTHPLDMDFIAECQVEDGSYLKSRQYLGECIANVGGYLIMQDNGWFGSTCGDCWLGPDPEGDLGLFTWLHCNCYDGERWGDTYINLDAIISNFHGLLSCLGHIAVMESS
ncbi:hypothetical protein QBC32DRAFT_340999 [Pseudoneurospora amorphoporcata]|uniref:Cyanovirin-N domain-containing protein n=1 Tax=Pseudoneurospora amorphoporcata TaxID=241081 RepID=A0AAN6SGV4_9PEZI|nr:hypothetical protein QBC32DRAFT_340999 [Pseudoneurospora amorphoporcata]